MKKFLCIVSFAFFALVLNAQSDKSEVIGLNPVNQNSSNVDDSIIQAGSTRLYTFDLSERKVFNNYYLDEKWFSAELETQNGKVLPEIHQVKYDILNDDLYVLSKGKELVIPKISFKSFTINEYGQKRKFIQVESSIWKTSLPYLEVLVDGDYKLLIHHWGKKTKGMYNPIMDAGSKDDSVKHIKDYYLLDNTGKLVFIPKKKRKAKKALNLYGITAYAKKNKIKFKREKDLIKFVNYLNE